VSAAPSTAPQWIALAIALMGLGGLVFTALRFNRDDTSAIVSQQSTVLHDMQAINEELRHERDDCRGELAELRRRG
jgi:hypothetical protein